MMVESITTRIGRPRVWLQQGRSMTSGPEHCDDDDDGDDGADLVGVMLDGRYRLEARIAAGGFGTIYRATAPSGEPVAIKVLHARHIGDPSVSARFRREAVTMASLCDPHTVTTYELGEDPSGARFIVMELLRGECLAERFCRTGALPWRSALAIVRGVCSSLLEAHRLGIIHRDLKPANIFLARAPYVDFVKVLDFGIAKIVAGSTMHDGSELTRIGQAIGTLEYMAPEQLFGGDIDGRTDLYTLGVVAYELICGRRPFAEETNAAALVTAMMTRRPTAPSMVVRGPLPPELDGVLLRCLERDPADRYADIRELADAIDRMLASPTELVTTQQMWRTPVHVPTLFTEPDEAEELTWIDARPPCELVVDRYASVAGWGDPSPALAPPPPPRRRALGTGIPYPDPTDVAAVPRPRFAVGSSPVIAGSEAPVVRTSWARLAMIALLLAVSGVAIGMAIAMITFPA
jgi:serine/threonine protein kinase